jgi:hypothetical protein
MNIDGAEIIAIFVRELRCDPRVEGDNFYFDIPATLFDAPVASTYALSQEELSNLESEIEELQVVDGSSVATDTSFELFIQQADPRAMGPLRAGELPHAIEDVHHGLTYEIARPSLAFSIAIIQEAHISETFSSSRFRINRMLRLSQDSVGDSTEAASLIKRFDEAIPFSVLRITSTKKRPVKNWRRFADAFLFHLGYNLDAALIPRVWQGVPARPARVRRVGRAGLSELDVPRRSYLTDLVHHYQLGISSQSPMLQYISFYHVAEHWFESIYQDDLVEEIQRKLTAPSFSFRRKKDIQDLIKRINRAVQLRNEELVINEQIALRLTLAKYVDLSQLVKELNDFSSSSINYYSLTKVPFSEGDTVQLNASDPSGIYAALSRRIYKTRNAIVHSKDGARGRFVPYTDDHALTPEIPLMRLIAEQVIVGTSEDQAF